MIDKELEKAREKRRQALRKEQAAGDKYDLTLEALILARSKYDKALSAPSALKIV